MADGEGGTFVQLRARDGRALLAGDADDHEATEAEVDPHNLALGADLADALHEWARVADAVSRNGNASGTAAATLISRRGRQLAGRIAVVMGRPVSYADPLTGEIVEIDVPPPELADEGQPRWWSAARETSTAGRHATADEPTPWATGLTVSFVTAVLMMIVVITLSLALGAANRWLPLIANVVIAVGLAPSVWLARRALVWRWIAFGVVAGIVGAWIALLFTAL
jgi:hypothetical protein